MKRVIVIAGNKREFDTYISRLTDQQSLRRSPGREMFGGVEYIYVNSVDQMRGLHGIEVRVIGTAHRLPEFREMMEYKPIVERP